MHGRGVRQTHHERVNKNPPAKLQHWRGFPDEMCWNTPPTLEFGWRAEWNAVNPPRA
jgi:hypothetical protein